MACSKQSSPAWRASLAALLLAGVPLVLHAQDAQRDPELRGIVQQAIQSAPCFADKYDSDVWFKLQEPRLRRLVKDPDERVQILETAYCEANRPDEHPLPPGLIMAVMDVESAFNRWAVSASGAVGLMQVMPFWPDKLGMKRFQLTQVQENMRMGCAILRFYLQKEHNDWRKALARYNGSVGNRKYPDLVITRWTTRWNGADGLGQTTARQ
jgi:soluble lytic murein transglycosylase-like protein